MSRWFRSLVAEILGKTDDRVQRVLQLIADVGEKFRLGVVREFGGLKGQRRLALGVEQRREMTLLMLQLTLQHVADADEAEHLRASHHGQMPDVMDPHQGQRVGDRHLWRAGDDPACHQGADREVEEAIIQLIQTAHEIAFRNDPQKSAVRTYDWRGADIALSDQGRRVSCGVARP
jgi:hypothetical protein